MNCLMKEKILVVFAVILLIPKLIRFIMACIYGDILTMGGFCYTIFIFLNITIIILLIVCNNRKKIGRLEIKRVYTLVMADVLFIVVFETRNIINNLSMMKKHIKNPEELKNTIFMYLTDDSNVFSFISIVVLFSIIYIMQNEKIQNEDEI